MLPQIPLLNTGDYKLDQIQKNIAQAVSNILKIPYLNGSEIKNVSLLSSDVNSINHKLGRKYQGYFITSLNANSTVWISNTNESETTINLSCSADCSINIWVY